MINYRARARQLINFSDMPTGKYAPTDIDGVIEYGNKVWIWLEYKFSGAEVPQGQRLTLERLVDELGKEKVAVAIVADHYEENTERDVEAGAALVRSIYFRGKWTRPKEEITVRELTERILKWAV